MVEDDKNEGGRAGEGVGINALHSQRIACFACKPVTKKTYSKHRTTRRDHWDSKNWGVNIDPHMDSFTAPLRPSWSGAERQGGAKGGGGEREGEGKGRGMGIDMVGKGRERVGQVGLEPLAPG